MNIIRVRCGACFFPAFMQMLPANFLLLSATLEPAQHCYLLEIQQSSLPAGDYLGQFEMFPDGFRFQFVPDPQQPQKVT